MGRAKEMMLEHEQNRALATGYLVQVGQLKECERHGEIYSGGSELEDDFWRNAMADRNRGKGGPVPWAADMKARDFTDALKAANEDHWGHECGLCAKNRDE